MVGRSPWTLTIDVGLGVGVDTVQGLEDAIGTRHVIGTRHQRLAAGRSGPHCRSPSAAAATTTRPISAACA